MNPACSPSQLMSASVTLLLGAAILFGVFKVTRTRAGRLVLVVMATLVLAGWAFFGFALPGS